MKLLDSRGVSTSVVVVLVAIILIVLAIVLFAGGDNGDTLENSDTSTVEETEDDLTDEEDEDSELSVDPEAKVFNITGRNFAFSQDEIRVRRGDTVTINFSSVGGFHDWAVDEFDARTAQVNTGQASSVTFVADTAGEFEYYCSVMNHRQAGMVGTLIVEE
jgi:plastocyanin